MRLQSAIIRGGNWTQGGQPIVSPATRRAYTEPSFVLFLRYKRKRFTSGQLFIFTIPPQSLSVRRDTRTNVQNTRHGYVVQENGLGAPTFLLEGHFGWQTKVVHLPPQMKGYAIKSNVHYDQHTSDVWIPLPFTKENGAEGNLEKVLEGKPVSMLGFTQTLDGREAFFALRDLIVYYHETNQKRMSQGKEPLEMVYLDTLHDFRWVVSPEHPTLIREARLNGLHQYSLALTGVYDDARPRQRGPEVWSH